MYFLSFTEINLSFHDLYEVKVCLHKGVEMRIFFSSTRLEVDISFVRIEKFDIFLLDWEHTFQSFIINISWSGPLKILRSICFQIENKKLK